MDLVTTLPGNVFIVVNGPVGEVIVRVVGPVADAVEHVLAYNGGLRHLFDLGSVPTSRQGQLETHQSTSDEQKNRHDRLGQRESPPPAHQPIPKLDKNP